MRNGHVNTHTFLHRERGGGGGGREREEQRERQKGGEGEEIEGALGAGGWGVIEIFIIYILNTIVRT